MTSRSLATVAAIVVVVAAFGIAVSRLTPPGAAESDIDTLVPRKNKAIAALEAGDYAAAADGFRQIAASLPDEPLGPRDLAITYLQSVEAADVQTRRARIDDAQSALDALRNLVGDTTDVNLLQARLSRAAGNQTRAVRALQQAARSDDGSAALAYELYVTAQDAATSASVAADAEEWTGIANAALARARVLAPDNVAVLLDLLLVQAEQRDPAIQQTVDAARAVLSPFVAELRDRTGTDLASYFGQIEAALQDGPQWRDVRRGVQIVANVMRPETVTLLDRRRLLRHDLEYLQYAFSTLEEPASSVARETPAQAPVTLTRGPDIGPLIDAADIDDLIVTELDLRPGNEIVIVRDHRLDIFSRSATGAWEKLDSLQLPDGFTRVSAVDLDRDTSSAVADCQLSDIDLVAFGAGGVLIIENALDPVSNVFALKARPSSGLPLQQVQAVTPVDQDHDGDLDLVLSTAAGVRIWQNRGSFSFADISNRSRLPAPFEGTASMAIGDVNRNLDIDVVLAGSGASGVLENLRHGRFRWQPFAGPWQALSRSTAVAIADVDGNASWDLLAAGPDGLTIALTRTPAAGQVGVAAVQTLSDLPLNGALAWDADNDGHLDVIAWSPQHLLTFQGLGDGSFRPVALLPDLEGGVDALDVTDLDGDGDLDVVTRSAGRIAWYRNDGGNANHAVDVALSGRRTSSQRDERVNVYGIGSTVEIKAGTSYQARIVTGPTTHFGLGGSETADVVRVLWTNGIPQNLIEPQPAQMICATQVLKGSCPYLYTHGPDGVAFLTDLLWSAPIGLQLAENRLAPTRAWEYLKIPGDRLVERDGAYQLLVTEELWEVAYFDQIELLAVDHPADIDIYSNEKSAPPDRAAFRIHTVADPQVPMSARDTHGRDVLELIDAQDGRFYQGFRERVVQGLVDEHFIELDLGNDTEAPPVTLFLTGWIFPTDTSLNVAISQDPQLPATRPPSLWVPDADGQWHQVKDNIGYPGGKTKTIAVDISDVFPSDDHRLRIVTNMEIYWDSVFFATAEQTTEPRMTILPLARADLRYRGFSARVPGRDHAPDGYDYAQVDPAPQWPPIEGDFTRYGDVVALLTATDDSLVVMGPGDELALYFDASANDLPAGWSRDFILHNVGWDKDADLNTVYGHAVEPLPFVSMEAYPYPPGSTWPDSARHRQYLQDYQTRRQRTQEFWGLLRNARVGEPPARP